MYLALATFERGPVCGVARAQLGEADANQNEAMQHFRRGVELYQEQSLEAALVEFERAYELYPNYKLLYNLAQLQSERHEYVTALTLYKRYLAEARGDMDDERRRRVAEEIRRLNARVGTLWVTSDQDGAQLFVDDQPVAQLPLSDYVTVNTGIRQIRLEKSGFKTTHETLKIAGGDRLRLNLPLVPESVEVKVQPAPSSPIIVQPVVAEPPAKINSTPFIVSAAAAGVLTVGAATFGVLANSADGRLDKELQDYPADQDAVDKARSRVRLFALATDGLIAGAVVASALALYFLVDPPLDSDTESPVGLGPDGITGRF